MVYSVSIRCGDDYPERPPQVKLVTRVNMKVRLLLTSLPPCFLAASLTVLYSQCVDAQGNVDIPVLRAWKREYTLETVLKALWQEMSAPQNKALPQPPEGTTY